MEICKHSDLCGGCIYQGIEYTKQVELKGRDVVRLLEEKKVTPEKYLGIVGSPGVYAYRDKMEYTFGNEVKDGEMTLGMHQRGKFMSIITTDECQLVHNDFNMILRAVLDWFKAAGKDFYHKRAHEGFLRNLIIRKGEHTNELLINLVTSSQDDLDAEPFVEMLLSLGTENEIVGILHTLNDNVGDAVNCEELRTLYGRDYYNEIILGLKFKVSAFSFFQTNIDAVERLYAEAVSMIEDVEGKTVYDLYCGTGTISQTLALRAKNVIGIEIVEEAVDAATENAHLNDLSNVRFIAGDVLTEIEKIEEKPDIIVLDPPRMGIHYKALPKITGFGVDQILYISCNPKTMADNLKFMELNGYTIKQLKCYDNFPFTRHVEAVALMSRA